MTLEMDIILSLKSFLLPEDYNRTSWKTHMDKLSEFIPLPPFSMLKKKYTPSLLEIGFCQDVVNIILSYLKEEPTVPLTSL